MKKQLTILILLLGISFYSLAQTNLQGKVTASETGEEIISANLVIKKNGIFVAGVSTDFNGNYSINLDPGTYDVTVSYLGYPDNLIMGVVIKVDQVNKLNVQLSEPQILICGCCFYFYYPPIIEIDNTTSGTTQISNDIQKSPFRDTKDLILNAAGVSPANY
jgi:Carboxypeptidase regulatory-like domain